MVKRAGLQGSVSSRGAPGSTRRWLSLPMLLAAILCGACTPIVEDGEVLELGEQDELVGRSGTIAMAPGSGVEVRAGGALILRGSRVTGGALRRGDPSGILPQSAITEGAPGIRVEGGTLLAQAREVSGGPTVVDLDFVDPPLMDSGPAFITPVTGGSAIVATDAVVEIDSGGFFGGLPDGPTLAWPSDALRIERSTLQIRGGGFVGGNFAADRSDPILQLGRSLVANRSRIEISGGVFFDLVQLDDSISTIRGGQFGAIRVGGAVSADDPPGCLELAGGSLRELGVFGNETAILVGSGFDRPLGPLEDSGILLSGTLSDGSILNGVRVFQGASAHIVLAAPGTSSCTALSAE